METIKEFFNGLFESTSERVKSVFLATYSILFIVWNWQLFAFLLFSTKSIEGKICIINSYYLSWWMFIFPFIFTVIYVFLMPWVNLWVDTGLKKSNDELIRRKKEKRIQKLKQKAEEASLEYEIATNKAGTNEIKEMQNTIDVLEESLKTQKEKVSELEKRELEFLETKDKLQSDKNKEISNLKSRNNKFEKAIIELNEAFNKYGKNDEKLILFRVGQIINDMTTEEQRDFLDIGKKIVEGAPVSNDYLSKRFDDFFANSLLFFEKNKLKFTFLGKQLFVSLGGDSKDSDSRLLL